MVGWSHLLASQIICKQYNPIFGCNMSTSSDTKWPVWFPTDLALAHLRY